MGSFSFAARNCLPDEALLGLLKWQKKIHPNDDMQTPNILKSKSGKGTDKNASGKVIFFNFEETLKENVEKNQGSCRLR